MFIKCRFFYFCLYLCIYILGCFSYLLAKDVVNVISTNELTYSLKSEKDNKIIVLDPGVYIGNFSISKPSVLVSKNFVVLTSNNIGSIISILSKDVKLDGVIFYNSGKNMSKKNSCIYINDNSSIIYVNNNIFSECGFGIWINNSLGNYISKNVFIGTSDYISSNRGNSIHLYYMT